MLLRFISPFAPDAFLMTHFLYHLGVIPSYSFLILSFVSSFYSTFIPISIPFLRFSFQLSHWLCRTPSNTSFWDGVSASGKESWRRLVTIS
jgi:hypothetical protein